LSTGKEENTYRAGYIVKIHAEACSKRWTIHENVQKPFLPRIDPSAALTTSSSNFIGFNRTYPRIWDLAKSMPIYLINVHLGSTGHPEQLMNECRLHIVANPQEQGDAILCNTNAQNDEAAAPDAALNKSKEEDDLFL
jgi:hypothetical protein